MIKISESEWQIMQILWKEPYLTLGEIKKRLDGTKVLDKTTINTMLRRLKKKEAIGVEEARYSKYYPLVSEDQCLEGEMTSILERMFYKSPKKLVATLVKQESFTQDDIDEIKALLRDIEGKND